LIRCGFRCSKYSKDDKYIENISRNVILLRVSTGRDANNVAKGLGLGSVWWGWARAGRRGILRYKLDALSWAPYLE
jgi:hypothetical protein